MLQTKRFLLLDNCKGYHYWGSIHNQTYKAKVWVFLWGLRISIILRITNTDFRIQHFILKLKVPAKVLAMTSNQSWFKTSRILLGSFNYKLIETTLSWLMDKSTSCSLNFLDQQKNLEKQEMYLKVVAILLFIGSNMNQQISQHLVLAKDNSLSGVSVYNQMKRGRQYKR